MGWLPNMDCVEGRCERFEVEYRMRSKTGEWRWILARGKCVARDEQGRALRLLGTHVDITERKRAEVDLQKSEQALRLSEAQMRMAQQLGHAGSWVYSLETERIWGSAEGLRMFGYPPVARDGPIEDIEVCIPERQRVHQALVDLIGEGREYNLEYTINPADGSAPRAIHSIATLERDSSGTPLRVVGFVQDISERRRLENDLSAAKKVAEDAARSKAMFLDIAAHELRNPVAAFSILLQLVQRQVDDGLPVKATTVARLRESADRVKHLVVDLLDVSRLEQGRVVLHPERTDIASLVSHCVEEFQLQAPGRRIGFVRPEQSIDLDLDPVRIFQVLSNLIDNAVKYTPEDRPIEVAIEAMPDVVRVSVVDHGDGIPEDRLASLFSVYDSGKSVATTRTKGLGLGLSVCRGIMELHGGTVGVVSAMGRGSTFYFDCPRKGHAP